MKTVDERIARLERRMFQLEVRIAELTIAKAQWDLTGCNCRRWSGRPLSECETYAQCVGPT